MTPEDQARAGFYGLLARLFYAPPDANLIAELLRAPAPRGEGERPTAQGEALAAAWSALMAACRSAFPALLEQEHLALFVGTGKAQVTPYLSAYLLRFDGDSPLVRLRDHLAAWGIARRSGTPETEDHISGLCETMRWLIGRGEDSLEAQRECFEAYVYPGGISFCDAVSACPDAKFYAPCARLLRAFLEIEHKAFEIA
jgi:TorA maturation chaperone TorD